MKEWCLTFKEAQQLKKCFPDKNLSQIMNTSRKMTAEEVTQCTELFPNTSVNDLEGVLKGRSFVRWYAKNGLLLSMIIGLLPNLVGKVAHNGPWYTFLDTHPLHAQAFEVVTSDKTAIPCALTDQPSSSFLAGKGVILLHILIIGFLSLVVSTFLKFTGRGDLIPLITFVGGSIVMYECMGLFWSIYEAIAYILTHKL